MSSTNKPNYIIYDEFQFFDSISNLDHFILDTSAISEIVKYEAMGIMDFLEQKESTLWYTAQVYMELMAIGKDNIIADRISFLDRYLQEYSAYTTKGITEKSKQIQKYFHNLSCYPSPVDLLLASLITLKRRFYLITGDLDDFPEPLFTRKAYILIKNDRHVRVLMVLQVNDEELGKIPT